MIEIHQVQFSSKLLLFWAQEERQLKSAAPLPQVLQDISSVLQSLNLISPSPSASMSTLSLFALYIQCWERGCFILGAMVVLFN